MSDPAYPRPYGSWLLLERLGTGGMSEVDLARRAVTEGTFVRFVVIKRIRASNQDDELYVRMFQDEARITAELSHENIAQVYDFGREGDEFYMAMEYVPGLDLRAVQIALAHKARLLPVRIALTVLVGVLRALQYAHTRVDQLGRPMKIVHRDVNPRNVMLSVNGEVKLIDFGVAKAADRLEKTEGHAVKGKYAYMAPEQIEGSREVDGRADLFSVALMYHELLTGRSPFAGLTEVQILHRIVSGKIPPLPDGLDHPDQAVLRRIHAKGLATNPDERYSNADAFRRDLEAALAPIGGVAPPLWIAELLRDANADGVADISRRLKVWRDGTPSTPRGIVPPPPPMESSGTLNVASIQAVPQGSGWLKYAVAGLGVSTAALLGVLALVAAAGFWVWQRGGDDIAPTVEADPIADAAIAPPVEKELETPIEAPTVPAPKIASRTPAPSTPTPTLPTTTPPTIAVVQPIPVESAPPEVAPVWTEPLAPATPAAEAASGFLNLTSRPLKLEVLLDGTRFGTTPLVMRRVAVGTHQVLVRDPNSGRTETRTIVVEADALVTAPAVILE